MYEVTILNKTTVAKDMITLETTKPNEFSFQAGQFVQFLIPNGEKITSRSYSIASTPSDPTLLFLIKLYDGGVASEYLRPANESDTTISTAGVNDTLTLSEVRGRFIVDETATAHLFIGTGSGMAPLLGMIRHELESKQSTDELLLYFGVRHMADIFWTKELDALAETYPNFSYHLTLSQPEEVWDGLTGRVTEYIEARHATYQTYLCGAPEMVMGVRKELLGYGAEPSQIHFEVY